MPDPTVRDVLLVKVDELAASMTNGLAEVRKVTERLHPERPGRAANALTMSSVMIEIRLRANARPLDEAGQYRGP